MDFKEKYNEYIEILKEELVPAMGCTEPIAIALAGAKAREVLGKMPTKVEVFCSGNVIKNAKSVTVPNTNGLFGIEAATMAGVVGGNAENRLEVLNTITDEDIVKINNVIAENICTVGLLDTVYSLHIVVIARHKEEYAKVEIAQSHTNIWKIEKNGEILLENPLTAQGGVLTDRSVLNIQDILEFANTVEIEKIQGVIERQIEYNSQIAEVGLSQSWGAQVGKTILKKYPNSVENRAKAKASAGSDARMSGCALPVITNSGSGNQGMTVSLPVIEYAQHLNVSREKLIRALAVSNLTSIHQKTGIGRLSAYCGAVSAACGSIVGIAYLLDRDYKIIADTITNTIANVGGMACDGAKASCAAKIASALDTAFLALSLAEDNHKFLSGHGIVKSNVEETIKAVGIMASQGMASTDKKILEIMIEKA